MDEARLERRLAALEAAVAKLSKKAVAAKAAAPAPAKAAPKRWNAKRY